MPPYDNSNERGELSFQVLRYEPKNFRFCLPDGRPVQPSRLRRLLYRLPEVLAADQILPVHVVEGEKDADRLWSIGLVATTNANGAGKGKWSIGHSRSLRGRSVIILPDNDSTGQQHAHSIAWSLRNLAADIRIVQLPGLPPKGDVSDWLDNGGTKDLLLELCAGAPFWGFKPPPPRATHDEDRRWDAVYDRSRIYGADLTVTEKLLLLILVDAGARTPSQEMLASWLSVTERRVRGLVAGLRSRKFLEVSRIGRCNCYRVMTNRLQNMA